MNISVPRLASLLSGLVGWVAWMAAPLVAQAEPEVASPLISSGFSAPVDSSVPPRSNFVSPQVLKGAAESVEKEQATPLTADDLPSDSRRIGALEQAYEDVLDRLQSFSAPQPDTFPSHKLTGFTQLDTAYYSQTPNSKATIGDAQNGTGFRRLRLAVRGKVAEFTSYQLEVDFATAGRPSFFDNYIDQGNLPYFGTVRVGQFCQPFSVDSLTGFRNLTFMERSLPFLAFVPFRRIGVQSSNLSDDEMTTLTYSGFRTGGFNNQPLGDNRFGVDFGDGDGYSFSTRMTHLLFYDEPANDRYLWHFGGGYNFSQLGRNSGTASSGTTGNAGGGPAPFYQTRVLPEFGPLGDIEIGPSFGSALNTTPLILDSGKYEASSFNLYGLESVAQYGPWGFTAEWMATQVNSVAGPVYYNGAYAQVAYRLTGEHRVYDKKTGTLTKLHPFTEFIPLSRDGIHGWGAFEVGARWSYVDILNPAALDGHYYNSATNTFTGSAATGAAGNGAANNATLGGTWFLNSFTKVQFNWIHSMLNNRAKGYSLMDLFVTRFQVDF